MSAVRNLGIPVLFFFTSTCFAQTIEVNRQNRTIEVVVTERVQVEPDVADVSLGCIAYGQTHDQAYQANLQIAEKVIKALTDAGVSKTQITSSSIELSETNPSDVTDQPQTVRKIRQFKAHQSWRVRVPAPNAQKIIDSAVQAGANGIEDINWDVADADALENRARTAAMEKARATAGDVVKSGGGKLGDLLYASNVVSGVMGLLAGRSLETASASLSSRGSGFPTPTFSLELFPQKVEKQATVRAVFALD